MQKIIRFDRCVIAEFSFAKKYNYLANWKFPLHNLGRIDLALQFWSVS